MEPIPLIPQINSISCPDTSHILREEFQDFLCLEKFPEKIADNLHEYNSKELELKSCGAEIAHSYNELKLNVEELTLAEKVVMTSQAGFLNQEPRKDLQFKLEIIYPSIDENIVQKYSLIKTEDIMPHITERIMNCKMQPEEFIFKDVCPHTKCNLKQIQIMKCVPCKYHPHIDLKITDSQHSKLAKINHYKKRRNEFKKKKKIQYDFTSKTVFDVDPKKILFFNFEKNIVYEKKIRLRNITNIPQIFQKPIVTNPKSKFSVQQNGEGRKLAPGICAYFIISFITSDLSEHFEDCLVFHVTGSMSISVQLSAWRDTPIIKGLIYQEDSNMLEDTRELEKDEVFNYTIDCGSILYGCSKDFNLLVQNFGGDGNFFVISEKEWVTGQLSCITENFILMLQDFTIYPAYFNLKKDELKEIKLTFTPTQSGLCLEKIYVLCDSNTVEELDIIGDCLYYEPYYIKFEMPDCPSSFYKKPRQPKNILHLGAIYSNGIITGVFKVHNTCTIPFEYEWRKNKYCKKRNFIPIECDKIEIFPDKGMFAPISTTDFQVTVKMDLNQFGLYKFVFSLYVLDIMEENLSEGPIFNIGQEYRNNTFEKCVTIQADKIEVQVHHIPLKIHIYPEIINFPTLFYDTKSNEKTIRVVNEGFCTINCEWVHDKGCGCQGNNNQNQVKIVPDHFELLANSSIDCFITIIPSSYKEIYETFVLSINSGFNAKTLPIRALVEKPHIKVSHTFLNFGTTVKRNSNVSAIFFVENETVEKLYWRVNEYRFVFEVGKFIEVLPKSLDSNCGILCHKGSGTRLEYKLDTSEQIKFLSVLVFYTMYDSNAYESSHVILVANILQPVIYIRNENYKEEVFTLQEEHFVHETITKTLCIHNDSPLAVKYSWEEPEGLHAPNVQISFSTWDGKLYPWSRCCVEVTLTFVHHGLLHDIFVPLSIEALPEPVYLQICCSVKPPQVVFSIPSQSGTQRYIDILWPTYDIRSEASIPCEQNSVEMEEYIPCQEYRYMDNDFRIISLIPEEDNYYLQYYPDDIISYLKNIEMPGEGPYHCPTEISISQEMNTAEIPSQRYPFLGSVFGSNTSIYSYFVEFRNVPCRQVCKKKIEIRNIMDIKMKFSITIKNFKSKLINRKKLDQLLINMNWIPDDKYTAQLSEYGIFVIVDPDTSELKNKYTVSVEIQVYAETWGIYLEELAIEVDDLPIFYLNIFIHIVGLPVEFPTNYNALDVSENIIRFGNYSVCSAAETRVIYLRNNCTIPYKIVWHVFIKDIADYLQSSINVAYDIFGFENEEESVNCKVRILNYIGKESTVMFDLFEISPREIYLKPNEFKSVQVTIKPEYLINNWNNVNVNALLLGHIYLQKEYQVIRNDSNFVVRNPEKDQMLIKIHLLAGVEPELDLNCITGTRDIQIAVSDFLKDDSIVTANIRLMFRNTTKFTMVVGVNIAEPYKIVVIRSEVNECTQPDKNRMYTCVVHADNCAEVLVNCVVDTDMLLSIADVLYKNIPHFLEDCAISKDNKVKITKPLNIYQQCENKQEIPLSVTFVFPLTVISVESLDFDQVLVGNEKRMTVTLLNKTISQTWYIAETHAKMGVFSVSPYKGYLYPAETHDRSAYLTVTFKPKDAGDYEDILEIVTCISHYRQEIQISGTGTYNEKYACKIIQ